MLTKKYIKSFMSEYGNLGELNFILDTILEFEKTIGTEVLNWTDSNVVSFLKSFKAISSLSLNKYGTVLRKFVEYICQQENIEVKIINTDGIDMDSLIDQEKLLSVTLSYLQYRHIKNQLSRVIDGEELNVRDKLIFELAWSSLTNEEIKLLKDSAISFVKNDYDEDIAILRLENRIVRIEDSEIVNDIKNCMREKYYVVMTKSAVYKKMSYRESDYLIKPINVGKNKVESYLNNPGDSLHKIFKANDIECKDIDVDTLTLEDIRRSKIVYMLSPENREYFNDETILGIFNLKSKQSLNWLKKISEMKYGTN